MVRKKLVWIGLVVAGAIGGGPACSHGGSGEGTGGTCIGAYTPQGEACCPNIPWGGSCEPGAYPANCADPATSCECHCQSGHVFCEC